MSRRWHPPGPADRVDHALHVLVNELRRADTAVGAPCHALAIARSGVRPRAATAVPATALTPPSEESSS